MILGAVSCKAFLPAIYLLCVVNMITSIIILAIVSIVLWRKLKDANRPNS